MARIAVIGAENMENCPCISFDKKRKNLGITIPFKNYQRTKK